MDRTIDECETELQRLGWSVGDLLVRLETGAKWMVYCHRGEQRIVAKAMSQTEAWQEARRLALAQ